MSDGTNTRAAIPSGQAPDTPQDDQLEAIESARMRLLNSKKDLEQKIQDLDDEILELRNSERQRQQRFRAVVRQLDDRIDAFTRQSLKQHDIYYARTYQSLADLRSRYQYAANPNTPITFERQLDEFAEEFPKLRNENDRLAAAKVGNLLGWLESAGQNLGLAAAVKSRYSKPNLLISISSRLINQFGSQSVQQTERVNENVLGRLIRGKAYVNGDVSIHLQPDPNQLRATIDFVGGIDADTYTRSGRLTAYAGSRSDFNFRRDVFANVGGLFANGVYGDLQLDTWFKCIDSQLRFIQRIAVKQYCKTKYRAEAISRERTIEKIRPPFEEQTEEALQQGFASFEDLNQQQTQAGRWLPSLFLSSNGSRLLVTGQRATQFDLGATRIARTEYDYGADVEVRIHESLLSNYASPFVAGRKLTNAEIAERLAEVMGDSFQPAEDDEEQEEVSITFADARPIQFEFEDNMFGVSIAGKRFTREDQRINDSMRIRLMFKIVNDAGRLKLIPAADPKVELDPEKKNVRNVSFASFLEGQLARVLELAFQEDVFLPDNLIPLQMLPENVRNAAADYKMTQLRMQEGWFYGGWSEAATGAWLPTDLPAIGSSTQPIEAPADDVLNTLDQIAEPESDL